jgi:hypothetical protein
MFVRWHLYDLAQWTTWLTLAVGVVVAALVYTVLARVKRRRLLAFANAEDLPWEELLELLQARHCELAASGAALEENLPPDQLLTLLLSRLPEKGGRSPQVPPEDCEYLTGGGAERRTSRRRWGNPIEVSLRSRLWPKLLHGLVINRSTGGFAIFVDAQIEPTTIVWVRPLEAPNYIKEIEVEVKHCRKIHRNFLIGCQSTTEVPWNILAWFG